MINADSRSGGFFGDRLVNGKLDRLLLALDYYICLVDDLPSKELS